MPNSITPPTPSAYVDSHSFTNRSIEYFARTDFGQREVEEVDVYLTPSERPLKQYISHRLWMMYRGGQEAPTLLESIHMALEKWLLAAAKQLSAEVIESWCLYLIRNSRSASITAVVASVALAESSKLFNVALVLFRTKDFFFFDLARMQFDKSATLNNFEDSARAALATIAVIEAE